jgi:hypothetical protein
VPQRAEDIQVVNEFLDQVRYEAAAEDTDADGADLEGKPGDAQRCWR